tara:strand:- start:104 stop:991 length:888 start_codon:yes stop_codon:yes gene_type:complete
MADPAQRDEIGFQDFVNKFNAKSQQVLRLKQVLMKRRHALLTQAQGNPNFVYTDDFVNSMRNITERERRIHRICEGGLEQANAYLAKIEGDIVSEARDKKSAKEVNSYLEAMRGLMRHVDKRLKRIDGRLVHEEHFLETRDKQHLMNFLKEYKKELLEDKRLERELEAETVNLGRLENTLTYRLKRMGIKVAAGAALPLTVPATIPLKIGELLIRPLTCLLADFVVMIFGGAFFGASMVGTEQMIKRMSLKERAKFEIGTTIDIWLGMVEALIGKIKEQEFPGIQKNHLFSGLKV